MWEYFLTGGPMMWPLLICSIIALAAVLDRFIFWKRLNMGDEKLCSDLCALKSGAGKLPIETPVGILPVLVYTGLSLPAGKASKAMESIIIKTLARMRKRMNLLDTMITAAPMLGIMGTVLGIIVSFNLLGESEGNDPTAIIGGIAQALITTFAGLGISVCCLFPYNYFNNCTENAQDKMEYWATETELVLSGSKKE